MRLSARALLALAGDFDSDGVAYEALADRIRLLISDGRIAVGTRLPSERELAMQAGRSRTTVAAAYQSLRESGHVVSHQGSGSRVTLPAPPPRGSIPSIAADFARAVPPPVEGLAEIVAEASGRMLSTLSEPGFDLWGREGLRQAIADRYTQRGVPTSVDQIVITVGAQHAIALLAHTLLARADVVLIESPTYPHAYDALRRAGARVVTTPVSLSGWDLDHLLDTLAQVRPAAAYLIPDFQNPTGASMPPADRARLAAAARAAGTTLIIDETTADLSIDRPWDDGPFARYARGGSSASGSGVVTIGSLSKSVWAGLRLGWIRADSAVIRRIVHSRPAGDLGTPQLEQLVGEQVVRELPRLLDNRRRELRVQRDALAEELARYVPQWTAPVPDGGLSTWIQLDWPGSSALASLAQAQGVAVAAGPRFSIDGGFERFLRLPFTADPAQIRRGVPLLAQAWEQLSVRGQGVVLDDREAAIA